MITSTHGVKLPEDGDKGQLVFTAINSNFAILRDHAHNGADSALIVSSSLSKGTLNLDSANWIADVSGKGYKQTMTFPGAYTLVNCSLRFRVRTGAHMNKIIHPTLNPVGSSIVQIEVMVNDSSLDLEVLFV